MCHFFLFLAFIYLLSPLSPHQTRLALPLCVFVVVCCVIGAAPHTRTHTRRRHRTLSRNNCQKIPISRDSSSFLVLHVWLAISLSFPHTRVKVLLLFSGIFFRSSRSIFSSGFFFGLVFSMLFLMMTLRRIHFWMIFPELPIGAGDDRRCGTVSSHGVHSLT